MSFGGEGVLLRAVLVINWKLKNKHYVLVFVKLACSESFAGALCSCGTVLGCLASAFPRARIRHDIAAFWSRRARGRGNSESGSGQLTTLENRLLGLLLRFGYTSPWAVPRFPVSQPGCAVPSAAGLPWHTTLLPKLCWAQNNVLAWTCVL